MIRTIFYLIPIICTTFSALAQNEASTCYFGSVGIDFRTIVPTVINPSYMQGRESPASICDQNGDILFYTNGGNNPTNPTVTGAVWNANHDIMENGILGDSSGCNSSAQGAIIVPFPSNDLKTTDNLYYIFTKDCLESSFSSSGFNSGLTYAVVDMNANNGLGKVTQKNVPVVPYGAITVHSTSYEPVSAILHGNNTDYWLFSYTNDSLYRLKITTNGIEDFTMLMPAKGEITISPNRDYLTCGNKVYHFDAYTGDLNYIGTDPDFYRFVFSADGSKLYGITNISSNYGKLYQFDMNAPNFNASKTYLKDFDAVHFLFLAPNHKIYCLAYNSSELPAYIRCPNSAGSTCEVIETPFSLQGGSSGGRFTNVMAHYLYYSGACTASVEDKSGISSIQLYPNPSNSELNIRSDMEIDSYSIRSCTGQIIGDEFVHKNEFTVDVSGLSTGIYVIRLNTTRGQIVERFIVE